MGFFKDEYGSSYTYDSKGNVVGVKDQANQNSTFQYDGNNNLIKSTNPRGGTFDYTYDATYKHRLTKAVTSIGLTYNFYYDTNRKC